MAAGLDGPTYLPNLLPCVRTQQVAAPQPLFLCNRTEPGNRLAGEDQVLEVKDKLKIQ